MGKSNIDVNALISRYDGLNAKKAVWNTTYQRVADYMCPVPYNFSGSTNDPRKKAQVLDSTATEAGVQLAHALNGSITNVVTDWFKSNVNDFSIADDPIVGDWLDKCDKIAHHYIQRSNFGESAIEAWLDLVFFGTAGMLIEPDSRNIISYSTRNIGELVVEEDFMGKIDTVFRKSTMTARAAGQRFDKANLSKRVIKMIEKEPDKEVGFLHVIMPRKDYDPTKMDKRNKPIASIWIDIEEKKIIEEGGFDENPLPVGRWAKVSGHVYGFSPAIQCLNDVLTLNKIEEVSLLSKLIAAQPPVVFDDDSLMSEFSWTPGIRVIKRKNAAMPSAINLGQQPQQADSAAKDRRDQIKSTMFSDIILNPTIQYVTATASTQNTSERERILGSIVSRPLSELWEPIVERTFAILARAGVFPPIPDALKGKDWRPVWTSPLVRKQLERRADGTMRLFQTAQVIAPFFTKPDGSNQFIERFDADRISADLADIFGKSSLCNSDYTLKQSRDAKSQAMQQQAMGDQALDAIPKIAQAESMTKDSQGPIGQLMKTMSGGIPGA